MLLPFRRTFDQGIADEICERIMNGESLRQVCRQDGMPHRTSVLRWLAERQDFATRYALAHEIQADYLLEDIAEIEERTLAGEIEPQVARVVLQSKQWRAAKLAPRKYGVKVDMAATVGPGLTIDSMSEEERAKRVAFVLARGLAAASRQALDAKDEEV